MPTLIHKVNQSKISVEKLMNQTALNSNDESTLTRTKPLTNRSNNKPNITFQLQHLYENQIMKEQRILAALAEIFLTIYMIYCAQCAAASTRISQSVENWKNSTLLQIFAD